MRQLPALKEAQRINAQRARERFQSGNGDVSLATLDAADVRAMVAADLRKLFLRPSLPHSESTDVFSDYALQPPGSLPLPRHCSKGRE